MDIVQSMQAMELAINTATSDIVKIWMNWMLIVFAISILFVWKRVTARYILIGFLLGIPIAVYIFHLTQSPHLVAISHFFVFPTLLFIIWKREIKNKNQSFNVKSIFNIWLILLSLTMIISLIFDVRDVYLVSQGLKP